MKENLIDSLGDNYILVNHPFPVIEGELLIYQYPEPDNLNDANELLYKDYSLKKRIKTKNYTQK
jgi:hypothetical protein